MSAVLLETPSYFPDYVLSPITGPSPPWSPPAPVCGNFFNSYCLTHFAISVFHILLSFIFYVWVLLFQIDFRLLKGNDHVLYLFPSLALTIFSDDYYLSNTCYMPGMFFFYICGIILPLQLWKMKCKKKKWLAPGFPSRLRIAIWISLAPKPAIFLFNATASTCE